MLHIQMFKEEDATHCMHCAQLKLMITVAIVPFPFDHHSPVVDSSFNGRGYDNSFNDRGYDSSFNDRGYIASATSLFRVPSSFFQLQVPVNGHA